MQPFKFGIGDAHLQVTLQMCEQNFNCTEMQKFARTLGGMRRHERFVVAEYADHL